MPTDLVECVWRDKYGVDEDLKAKVDDTTKLVFMDAGLVWVCHKLGITADHVMANEAREEFVEDQSKEIEEMKKAFPVHLTQTGDGLWMYAEPGQIAKVIVPTAQRKKLTLDVHTALQHSGQSRTLAHLKTKYIWPRMAQDAREWVEECAECKLAKARLNITHQQYQATEYHHPRRAYAVDFYSIGKSKAGHVGILTIIDLFLRAVRLVPVFDNTGETAARVVLEEIVFKYGAFKVFVSDGDRAFVGRLVEGLLKALGTEQITTFHWARGNAVVERVHVIVGEALRLMSKDARAEWNKEMPRIEFAANAAHNVHIGMSPFKAKFGSDPVFPFDLKFGEAPERGEETWADNRGSTGVYGQMVKNLQVYHALVEKQSRDLRVVTNERLNKRGKGKPTEFKIGDRVIIYVPQSGEEGWKAKHTIQWRRGKIVQKLSRTYYMAEDSRGRKFQRSVACLAHDASRPEAPEEEKEEDEEDDDGEPLRRVGNLVAVKDTPESKEWWVAEILSLREDGLHLHYYGTRSTTLTSAVFRKATIEHGTRKTILGRLRRGEKGDPWTGDVPDDPDLVLFPVQLMASGKLSQLTLRRARGSGVSHAVLK